MQKWKCWVTGNFNSKFTENTSYYFSLGLTQTILPPVVHENFILTTCTPFHQHKLFILFVICAITIGVRWYPIIDLIWISLILNIAEHFLRYLLICLSYLEFLFSLLTFFDRNFLNHFNTLYVVLLNLHLKC